MYYSAGFPPRLPMASTTASPTAPFSAPGVIGAVPPPATAAPKKTGKWNAMHVRIAWEIYNHQQKAKTDAKPGSHPGSSLPGSGPPKHGFDLLNKPSGTPGADFLGKRPGPPQELLRAHNPSTLYGASLGLPAPPNPFDPLASARDPYGAYRSYGSSPLGESLSIKSAHIITKKNFYFSTSRPSYCLPSISCPWFLCSSVWRPGSSCDGSQQPRQLWSHDCWPTRPTWTPRPASSGICAFKHGPKIRGLQAPIFKSRGLATEI